MDNVYYDGSWGTSAIKKGDKLLREWKKSTFKVGENGHRHMSHLMCIYPFNQVTPSSPYFEAALNSMKLRGDGATGWSMGWKINLWARVLDGDHARQILRNALKHSGGGAGVFYNLYDSHAPFQIDGNFGACAGIAEMCLQSHTDTLQLLPALPSAWTEGRMTGLRATRCFEVDQQWAKGKLTRAVIRSEAGQPCYVKYEDIASRKVVDAKGNTVAFETVDANTITFPTEKGGVYTIDFTGDTGIGSVEGAAPAGFRVEQQGTALRIHGKGFSAIQISDLSGKPLFAGTRNSVELSPAWGKLVLVTVTATGGKAETHKMVLN